MCSEEAVSPPGPSVDVSALIQKAKPRLEELRGLSFKRPVYRKLISREQYITRFVRYRDTESPAIAAAATNELFQLGLLTDTVISIDEMSEEYETLPIPNP